RIDRALQRCGCYAPTAILLVNHEARYPPQFLVLRFKPKPPVVAIVVHSGKFLALPVLAPSNGLSIEGIDDDPMRSAHLKKRSSFTSILNSSFGSGVRSCALARKTGRVMKRAPAPPGVSYTWLLEQLLKVRPGRLREFLCFVGGSRS